MVLYRVFKGLLFSVHYVTKIPLCCHVRFIHFHGCKVLRFVKISQFIYPFFLLWALGLFQNHAAMNTPSCTNTRRVSHSRGKDEVTLLDVRFCKVTMIITMM